MSSGKSVYRLDFLLETLRHRIPDFDERCRNFYRAWKYAIDLRLVKRMGYSKMGFFNDEEMLMFFPNSREFDDAVHVLGMVYAVVFFKDFFGEYIPWLYGEQPQWLDHIEEALMHEIGEITIGDWTEDGSYDSAKKDALEQKAFDEFMRFFPPATQRLHQKQFADVRENRTIVKLFDKEAFILGIGYLKSKGIAGDMHIKRGLTEQDRAFCEETGSERAIDNIFAHLLKNYRGTRMLAFFVGITEAIYAEDYQEIDPLVKDCVPGAPPPGVKMLYNS